MKQLTIAISIKDHGERVTLEDTSNPQGYAFSRSYHVTPDNVVECDPVYSEVCDAKNTIDTDSPTSVLGSCRRKKRSTAYSLLERGPKDYSFQKIIGRGSFSTVYLGSSVHSNDLFAIRVFEKSLIIKEKAEDYVQRGKEVQRLLTLKTRESAPFFIKLYATFEDEKNLYFVLSFAQNGELLTKINKERGLDVALAKFYAAEILHALEHMHSLGIIHRDLKSQNILLDEKNHILISDFGSAKVLNTNSSGHREKRNSFVGTASYMSPEVVTDAFECSRATDLWAFGTILYEMLAGRPAFSADTEHLIFRKIRNLDYKFPDGFCPFAKDLVRKLLVRYPMSRLGALDGDTYVSIRSHSFFFGIRFETLYQQTPPTGCCDLPRASNQATAARPNKGLELEQSGTNRQIPPRFRFNIVEATPARIARRDSELGLSSLTQEEIATRLSNQKETLEDWHYLLDGKLILKRGLVKKKGKFFWKRSMLLLTLCPHLYYADPHGRSLQGEIPWSSDLRARPVTDKLFCVQTPRRLYYFKDPEGQALKWCKAIDELQVYTFGR